LSCQTKLLGMRDIRKGRGLTFRELSERLGVSVRTVMRWEHGQYEPDISTIKNLTKIFHCTIDELLEGPSEEHEKRNVIRICKNGNIVEVEYSKEKEEALLGKKQGALKS